ncbi:MAG: EAL domain-containing protein [Proteobacteria bacterium]|nr:EAL domain-containing protein [Pseudomonadota bacterium]
MKLIPTRWFQSFRLNALLALALLPGMLTMTYVYYSAYQSARDAARQNLLSQVRTMSHLVDQNILDVKRSLELLAATSDDLDPQNLAAFRDTLQAAHVAIPLVDTLQLHTPDGKIVLSNMETLGIVLPRPLRTKNIEQAARESRSMIGNITQGSVSDRLVIPIDVPVRIHGKIQYVLSAGIYCEHINAVLNSQLFPPGWNAVIYDAEGSIAGRRLDAGRTMGTKVAPSLLQWLTGPAERLGEGGTLEGRASVAAMHRSTETGYSVTTSVPTSVLDTPLLKQLATNLLLGGAGLIVGIWLAWLFVQGLRAAILRLETAVDAVTTGQMQSVTIDGPVELVQLTHRFNNMQHSLIEAQAIQERYQRELEHAATHDPLTGLANRALLDNHIQHVIATAVRSQGLSAILLLDLDHFKIVNDTLSHAVGDALLVEMAKRMQQTVRNTDIVGRLGGDEFLIVLSNTSTEAEITSKAQQLLAAITEPVFLAGQQCTVSASVGIALVPRDGLIVSDLLMNADIAMYRAKDSGRNRFQFFEKEMNSRMQQRLELESGLRQALIEEQFVLYYQARCDAKTGHIVGAEALIRWKHPTHGLISPANFIPVAEETGLIVPMGEWVLRTACTTAQRWRTLRPHLPTIVSVNVSARQFQSENLAGVVAQHLHTSGLPPDLLELELTETDVMRDATHTLKVLKEIKQIGVHVSLDDFGTGYSSLGYLKRFPVDYLKIDQSFVRDISVDAEDEAIANMVIMLGHSLGLKIVAEGVETQAQLAFLQAHGCDQIQGYLYSPPIPAEEFEVLLQKDPIQKLVAL